MQLTPVFLLRESHEQKSLAGYSPVGCKESDLTKQPTLLLLMNIRTLSLLRK